MAPKNAVYSRYTATCAYVRHHILYYNALCERTKPSCYRSVLRSFLLDRPTGESGAGCIDWSDDRRRWRCAWVGSEAVWFVALNAVVAIIAILSSPTTPRGGVTRRASSAVLQSLRSFSIFSFPSFLQPDAAAAAAAAAYQETESEMPSPRALAIVRPPPPVPALAEDDHEEDEEEGDPNAMSLDEAYALVMASRQRPEREVEEEARGSEVDAKAEEFIRDFKEDLRQQRLNSIFNYTQMLKQRGLAAGPNGMVRRAKYLAALQTTANGPKEAGRPQRGTHTAIVVPSTWIKASFGTSARAFPSSASIAHPHPHPHANAIYSSHTVPPKQQSLLCFLPPISSVSFRELEAEQDRKKQPRKQRARPTMASWLWFFVLNSVIAAVAFLSRARPPLPSPRRGAGGLTRMASSSVLQRLRSFSIFSYPSTSSNNNNNNNAAPSPSSPQPAAAGAATAAHQETEEEPAATATAARRTTMAKQSPRPRALPVAPSPKAAERVQAPEDDDDKGGMSMDEAYALALRARRRPERERETAARRSEVDAKADEFIRGFKEDLRQQRLNSIFNYTQMLKRRAFGGGGDGERQPDVRPDQL
ncbi:hypothetical protein HU200_042159 [Digitaria exilis]|uniref:Uncharacterized protein n=1 Tax=Digitaria exilis TaxID=1010633 RepID=A0A835B5A6_9POAL|nr:hypothetical protein HU200_042159 [Digitaria exilis]